MYLYHVPCTWHEFFLLIWDVFVLLCPIYALAVSCDPNLAIARARASWDHAVGRPQLQRDILNAIESWFLAKASSSCSLDLDPEDPGFQKLVPLVGEPASGHKNLFPQ